MKNNQNLYIKEDQKKGRGVYTSTKIQQNETIEICHVIVCEPKDLKPIHETKLHDYYFLWGEKQDCPAIALGNGSLYNHSKPANADFILDYTNNTIEFFALRDINADEEITIDYHAGIEGESDLWF